MVKKTLAVALAAAGILVSALGVQAQPLPPRHLPPPPPRHHFVPPPHFVPRHRVCRTVRIHHHREVICRWVPAHRI